MKRCLACAALLIFLCRLCGETPDRQYTEDEFQNSVGGDGTVFIASDVVRLLGYAEGHRGDFYDHALQGVFLNAVRRRERMMREPLMEPRLKIIQELYDGGASRQCFRETLSGVRRLLRQKNGSYSPCAAAFCLITEIMPRRSELESSDVDFFLDCYARTDNKIIQHAIYTAVLNGETAVEHKDVVLKHGSYLDVFYLLVSLVRATHGEERDAWSRQLRLLGKKSPALEKYVIDVL